MDELGNGGNRSILQLPRVNTTVEAVAISVWIYKRLRHLRLDVGSTRHGQVTEERRSQ